MTAHSDGERFTLISGPEPDLLREFREAAREGLAAQPKRLPCQYLYDARGSQLFDEICRQPEYYPTRTEAGILKTIAEDVVNLFEREPVLVELGSGSADKTRSVIEALLARHGKARFEPIDVSRAALESSAQGLLADYAKLVVYAVADDYIAGFEHLAGRTETNAAPRLILWLGSSIGNFQRDAAGPFLAQVRAKMKRHDRLLVGFDLRKDAHVLEAAYDDAAGVTAAFIRNLLTRMNRELGADFRPEAFAYRATYDVQVGRVEMWLESPDAHVVTFADPAWNVKFEKGEGIHMENPTSTIARKSPRWRVPPAWTSCAPGPTPMPCSARPCWRRWPEKGARRLPRTPWAGLQKNDGSEKRPGLEFD